LTANTMYGDGPCRNGQTKDWPGIRRSSAIWRISLLRPIDFGYRSWLSWTGAFIIVYAVPLFLNVSHYPEMLYA